MSAPGKRIGGWKNSGQITDPRKFHPQCRPQEVFDPKAGACVPVTNVGDSDPVGTLECPEGFVLDKRLGLCAPEDPTIQASYKKPKKKKKKTSAVELLRRIRERSGQKDELKQSTDKNEDRDFDSARVMTWQTCRDEGQQKFSGKMERCIQDVKEDLRKDDRLDEDTVKSRAIAICRDQLGG